MPEILILHSNLFLKNKIDIKLSLLTYKPAA